MKKIIMHSRINMDISPGAGRGLAYFIEHELLPRKESQIKTSRQRRWRGGGGFSEFQIGIFLFLLRCIGIFPIIQNKCFDV